MESPICPVVPDKDVRAGFVHLVLPAERFLLSMVGGDKSERSINKVRSDGDCVDTDCFTWCSSDGVY